MTEHRDKTLTQLKLIKKGIRRKATQITHNKPKDECFWNNLPPSSCSCFFQNGILYFCGFQVLAPQIFWSPAHSPPAARTAMLEGWRTRLKGLLTESPLSFARCELFDLSFQGGFLLRPEVKEELATQPLGISTGHHLGKPLPPDNQTRAPATAEDE